VNIEQLNDSEITFFHPFLPFDDRKKLINRLEEELTEESLSKREIKQAVDEANQELENYKTDVRNKGKEVLEYMNKNDKQGIVLAGRPYHIDPEINHGIPELIQSFDLPVISEDAISRLSEVERPLRVVDQWVYHTRLYSAAAFVTANDNLELVQLNSFGCGLDSVTIDQVQEILERHGKIYTSLKIDQISNLGAAKIRLRSLIATMEERKKNNINSQKTKKLPERIVFTEEMKDKHTILAPLMSPIHFQFLEKAFQKEGYNMEVLPAVDQKAVDTGLKYVNNDACYPSILVVGQLIHALQSGKYDLNNISIIISQTGGGCRATNYIGFIRKALKDAGLNNIPVISLNAIGTEENPGFKITLPLLDDMIKSIIYGDILMRVLYKVLPYEEEEGSASRLYKKWTEKCKHSIMKGGRKEFKENLTGIVEDFDNLPINEDLIKPKVGVVGEILVKYHPTANNNIVKFLESEGVEVVVPDMLDFFLYTLYNQQEKYKNLSGRFWQLIIGKLGIKGLEFFYRRHLRKALQISQSFNPPETIYKIAEGAKRHLSLCNQTGEGWFLTGEMVELIEDGVKNILCLQPFGCLPNHVTGKGIIKELRNSYSGVNIKPIDYDSGSSEVNQLNRIKLMLSKAFKNMEEQSADENEAKTFFDEQSVNIYG